MKTILTYVGWSKTGKPVNKTMQKNFCTFQKLANSFGKNTCKITESYKKIITINGKNIQPKKNQKMFFCYFEHEEEDTRIIERHFFNRTETKEKERFVGAANPISGFSCPTGWCK